MKRTFKWSTLKHLLCAGAVLVQCMVSAAVLQWTAEVAQPLPYDAQLFQGETMEFCAKLVNYGAPLTSAGTATFYYQSPDMGETEWYTSPVTWEPATGTARLTWTPAMDAGAKRYRFFIGLTTADGTLYRVYGSIQMRASPGFSPGTPIPQDSLAKVEQWLKECRDLVAAAETARAEEDAALLEKIEALETVDEAVAEALIGKAEVEHEHPQYLTALPEGLVTQAEVTEALAQKAAVDHTHEALEARVEALEGATGDSAEVGEVRSALANEVVAREAGDSALSGRVATVESRISIVENNQSDLKQKADAEALTAEVSARQAGDAALEQALALETAQRQTQLTALANAVNSKASATHGHAMAEVAGLEDALAARALQTQADALSERVGALEATAGASAEVGEVRSALADEVRAREAGDSALSGRVTTVESRINIVENNVAEIRGNVETAVTTVANAVQAAETAERRSEAYEAAAEEALQTVTQLSGKLDERLDNFGAEVAESAEAAVKALGEEMVTSLEGVRTEQAALGQSMVILDEVKIDRIFGETKVFDTEALSGVVTNDYGSISLRYFTMQPYYHLGLRQALRLQSLTLRYGEDIYDHCEEPEVSGIRLYVAREPYEWSGFSQGTPYELLYESEWIDAPKGTLADGDTYCVKLTAVKEHVIDPRDTLVVYALGKASDGTWSLYPLQLQRVGYNPSRTYTHMCPWDYTEADPSQPYDDESNALIVNSSLGGAVKISFEYTEEVLLTDLATRLETLETGGGLGGGVSEERLAEAIEAALAEEVATREEADVKLSAQVPVVRATLPNANNNANGYGYRGPLSRLGVYGEAVVIRRLAITTRASGNQNTTVPLWARVVRNVDGAWVVCAQAKEPRKWEEVAPGAELAWEMVPVPGVLPPSADEEVAIVWVNDPDAPAAQSDGQVSWRTVSVAGGLGFALPNVPTTSSSIQSWSPRIVLDFTAVTKALEGEGSVTTIDETTTFTSSDGATTMTLPWNAEPNSYSEDGAVGVAAIYGSGLNGFAVTDGKGNAVDFTLSGSNYGSISVMVDSYDYGQWSRYVLPKAIDSSLNATSTNPVQNKVLYSALNNKADKTALNGKASKIEFNSDNNTIPYVEAHGTSTHALRTVFNANNEADNWAEKFDNAKLTFEWWHQYNNVKEDSFDVPMTAFRALAEGGGGNTEVWKGNVGFGEQDTFFGPKAVASGEGQFYKGYPRLHNHGQDIHEVSGFSRDSRDDESVWSHRLLLPWDLAKANDTSYLMAGVVWNGKRRILNHPDYGLETTFVQPLIPENTGGTKSYGLTHAIPCFENSPMYWNGNIIFNDSAMMDSGVPAQPTKAVIVPWARVEGLVGSPSELALKSDVDALQALIGGGSGGGASVTGEATGVYIGGGDASFGFYKKDNKTLYANISGSLEGDGNYDIPTTAVTTELNSKITSLNSSITSLNNRVGNVEGASYSAVSTGDGPPLDEFTTSDFDFRSNASCVGLWNNGGALIGTVEIDGVGYLLWKGSGNNQIYKYTLPTPPEARTSNTLAWQANTSLLTVTPDLLTGVTFDVTGWPEGGTLLVKLTTPEDFELPEEVRLVGYFALEPASTYQLSAYVVGGVMHLVPLVKED